MTSGTNYDIRDWVHGDCREFERSWLKRWNARNAQPPPCLYHYTNADGARGIVTSQTMWGTDARYLNDTSELSYVNTVVHLLTATPDDCDVRYVWDPVWFP